MNNDLMFSSKMKGEAMKKITIKFWTGAAALGLLCQAAPFTVRAQEGKIWEETRETQKEKCKGKI